MIVRDAYGREHELPDAFDQDIEIELEWLKPWGNSRWGNSVASRFAEQSRKKKQKEAVREALEQRACRDELPLTVLLTRVTHRGVLDDDNVPDCMKYVRDEIARWLGLKSDRRPGLRFLYDQQRTRRRGFVGVRVSIIKPKETA